MTHAALSPDPLPGDAEARRRLRALLEEGLPLSPRPWQALGERCGLSEDEAMACVRRWQAEGLIKRLGLVVRHRRLGIRANAMVVWDVPDDAVHAAGRRLAGMDAVRLCYRRPRRMPDWPYNLFCMVHGRDRNTVSEQVERISSAAGLAGRPRDVLFSVRRFKQRGARYDFGPPQPGAEGEVA